MKGDVFMHRVNIEKLNVLRDGMHLSLEYLAGVLSMDSSALLKHHQQEDFIVSDEQLALLCKIFNVDAGYLFEPIEESEFAFARSNGTLNSHEKNQIAELRHLKKMLASV